MSFWSTGQTTVMSLRYKDEIQATNTGQWEIKHSAPQIFTEQNLIQTH
jgi:hypothetical protein